MRRLAVFIFLLFAAAQAGAQSFPAKPIKIVVGYPPGGSGDFTTRIAADELSKALGVSIPNNDADWTPEEVYLDLAGPGVDGSLTIDRVSGALTYEHTSRGWVSFFNDLHKGRNTGAAWGLFIDLFAFAALVFSITGLFLLQLHAGNRPSTWPLVGFGLLFPLILLILFVHQ